MSNRRKYLLSTVSVKLGCSCKMPTLSSIFNPKPKSHSHPSSSDESYRSRDKSGNSYSTTTTTTTTTASSSTSSSTADGGPGRVRVGPKSMAVEKDSSDPYMDFRQSMLQMIVENQIESKDELKALFTCFIQINSPSLHGVIIRVFTEIWNSFFFSYSPNTLSSP